jgi:hypothetical protein
MLCHINITRITAITPRESPVHLKTIHESLVELPSAKKAGGLDSSFNFVSGSELDEPTTASEVMFPASFRRKADTPCGGTVTAMLYATVPLSVCVHRSCEIICIPYGGEGEKRCTYVNGVLPAGADPR